MHSSLVDVEGIQITIKRTGYISGLTYVRGFNANGSRVGTVANTTPAWTSDRGKLWYTYSHTVDWGNVSYVVVEVVYGDILSIDITVDGVVNCLHEDCNCENDIHSCFDSVQSGSPISLRTGEKREEVTDLLLVTAVGRLDFTRKYKQNKQNDPQMDVVLGLGWSHNHHFYIDDVDYASGLLYLYLNGGGRAHFAQDPSDASHFLAEAGGTSEIIVDSGSSSARYTLKASNLTSVFDGNGKLQTKTWKNGEVWTYNYYASGYASGLLESVAEGYGRQLNFAYIDNNSVFDNLQLWRVGDQTALDLDTGSPTGRYVEFSYVENKIEDSGNPGTIINGGQSLLASFTDVRGYTWTYTYEQSNLDSLNYLKQVTSPDVDTDGDSIDNGSIIIKDLAYTITNNEMDSIQQRLGKATNGNYLQTIDLDFKANGGNDTLETIAGISKRHQFVFDQYMGTEDGAGQGVRSKYTQSFRPFDQTDANGNTTGMQWSDDGKRLESVSDAQDNETAFAYDSQDRLISSTDAEGRITEYTYGDTNVPRQPTVIKVKASDGTTLLRQQDFVYDTKGRTTSEKLIDPTDGTTALQETARVYGTSGTGNGLLESIEIKDLLDSSNNSSTAYSYDAQGRVIRTNKTSMFGTCQYNHTVYDAAGNVLGTACGLVTASPIPSDEVALLALYDATDSQKKHTRITTHDYDEMGRRVSSTSNAGTSWSRTNRTLYDALGRVTRSIQNYVAQGSSAPGNWIWDESAEEWHYSSSDSTVVSHGTEMDENILSDTQYNERGLVNLRRDIIGRVTLYGYNTADRLVKTVQNASDDSYDMSYATGDPDLSAYSVGSDPDEDMITEQVYDPNGNVVKSIDARGSVTFTALDALNRPVKVISNASLPEYDILADLDLSS